MEYITVDLTSEQSIKDGERRKASLENAGYTLASTQGGLFWARFCYKKENN